MQPTPLFGEVKLTAAHERPSAGAVRRAGPPRIGPALARALRVTAEHLDPAGPIRAVGQTRPGAGP